VILFIDEIHTLVGAGAAAGSAMDGANMLKPALASGTIKVDWGDHDGGVSPGHREDRALEAAFSSGLGRGTES